MDPQTPRSGETRLEDVPLDVLESAVKEGIKLLDRLEASLEDLEEKADAQEWIMQLRWCSTSVSRERC